MKLLMLALMDNSYWKKVQQEEANVRSTTSVWKLCVGLLIGMMADLLFLRVYSI